MEALTAKRTEITQIIEGSLESVKNQANIYGLEILSITPDYMALIKNVFQTRRLSLPVMTVFFNDLADMQKAGLSLNESIDTLNETTAHMVLKKALKKISNYINDGRSLQEAFENTSIFPKIVTETIGAAEKTGTIPELMSILSGYYKYKHENMKKIAKALIYPAVIFCMLSGLSVFISLKLVPELKTFLPACASHNLSAIILISYAAFIKQYWWAILVLIAVGGFTVQYLWNIHKERLMGLIFKIPLLGDLMKSTEFSHVFLNLYVYQKSGIDIIETISNIHEANKTYLTEKLIVVRDKIFKGASLGEAFRQDKFFPPFISQNVTKGQTTGMMPACFERIYKYYDIKTKESIDAMIAMVEPLMLIVSASFLLMIVSAFILPIYTNMNQMGAGIFK
ncbi:MAG: type II secretion system F family protein [Candidatus Omnitrophica bacterium]|nr:type II secretion system F family protein [Candidatus Omnitrophota bacterium]MDE2009152.1 type II secretion system F family protein [Candidatus Omnitrophota bacterium]MDE2213673.1 type II secretion system F family protein [Candidatus Omnitrophota bacterium]MDE2230752.1 type II secretion system F family protein [Candidatus Omnitrophota bacterium]